MKKNQREKMTMRLMVATFCQGNHERRGDLCERCRDLVDYADARLEKCPHRKKPKCKDCRIHCYDKVHREAIRAVMRYSGWRLLLTHPIAALRHQMGI